MLNGKRKEAYMYDVSGLMTVRWMAEEMTGLDASLRQYLTIFWSVGQQIHKGVAKTPGTNRQEMEFEAGVQRLVDFQMRLAEALDIRLLS